MSLIVQARVGKKFSVYLPKVVVKAVGLKEGDRLLLKAHQNRIILEIIHDPLDLAISGKKFASVAPEQIEAVSLEEQEKYFKSSS